MSAEHGSQPMIVTSAARSEYIAQQARDSDLPSLIDDARENPLARIVSERGEVLVKTPAFPYVTHHALVIPDLASKEPTPDPFVVPDSLLQDTFETAAKVAEHYLDDPEVREVNIGWNHSRLENKKHVATQQKTLNIHVIGFTDEDILHTVSEDEVASRPELRMKKREPLAPVINTLLAHEVYGDLDFSSFMTQIEDDGRITFELPHGLETLGEYDFALLMRGLHMRAEYAYRDIASRFFEPDPEDSSKFLDGEDGRFALLPREERIAQMKRYIDGKPYQFPAEQEKMLKWLARNVKSMDELGGVDGKNKLMALKGLAYATSIAGVKRDDGSVSWRFGMDPVVFAPRDVLQASRGTFAHFERPDGAILPVETLQKMEADEASLKRKLEAA